MTHVANQTEIDDPFAPTRFYTIQDICRGVKRGRTSLYKDITNGDLVPTYFGRAVRFSGPDFKRYLETRQNSRCLRRGPAQ